jgi:predicted glycoside hydrolase/deacetylase ChbG (UPF0249 family)
MTLKVIVNADDLGISKSVNEAIFRAMQRGTITSATLLANGPAVQAAAQDIRMFPKCSFGIHLNLTEFEPVCLESKTDLKAILNGQGCFNGNSIRQVQINAATRRAVFREWCAQIDRLMSLGVELSHFDGHHHVHTIPQLMPVVAALRRKYKIGKIRISRNMYDASEMPGRGLLAKKSLFNAALRVVGFKTTRLFTDLITFIKLSSAQAPGPASAELMTHPGSSPGSEESVLLDSDWPSRLSYPIDLVSYKSL